MSRVLLVEPDFRLRGFIAGILTDFGHCVETGSTAEHAEAQLGRGQFDAIATDLVLDDQWPFATGSVPIITLSGELYDTAIDRHDRPPRLVEKPFRFDDLRRLVAALKACEQELVRAA